MLSLLLGCWLSTFDNLTTLGACVLGTLLAGLLIRAELVGARHTEAGHIARGDYNTGWLRELSQKLLIQLFVEILGDFAAWIQPIDLGVV